MKKAFATCQHCQKQFLSPVQDIPSDGVTGRCPFCKKETRVTELDWHEIALDGATHSD